MKDVITSEDPNNKCFLFKETSAMFDIQSVEDCFQQIARHCHINKLCTEELGLMSSMSMEDRRSTKGTRSSADVTRSN